jgi:hypothetical protein
LQEALGVQVTDWQAGFPVADEFRGYLPERRCHLKSVA